MRKIISVVIIAIILSVSLITTSFAADKGGFLPAIATCCLGSRVGLEMNEGRKIRLMEWLQLVISPIPQIWMAIEAYDGKTMSEIAASEGL